MSGREKSEPIKKNRGPTSKPETVNTVNNVEEGTWGMLFKSPVQDAPT